MMRTPWAALAVTCACGARSALDVPERLDAAPLDASPDTSPEPICTALNYTSDDALNSPSLAVTGGYVYYVSANLHGIIQMPVAGGTPTVLAADPSGWASAFVVDATYVWWVIESNGTNGESLGRVARVPTAGGATETLGCSTPNGCPAAVDTQAVVVAQTTESLIVGSQFVTNIYVVPKAGGSSVPLVPLATAPTAPFDALTATDTSVFWGADLDLYEAMISADSEQVIVAAGPTGLTSYGENVYWTLLDHGTSSLVRDTSGTMTTLFNGPLSGPLAANASSVYGMSDGGISRVSANGGASVLVLPNIRPKQFVVDGACIYFIDGAAVRRVPG